VTVANLDWVERRRLGQRNVAVTGLGLGCAPIGNLFTAVSDEAAQATVDAAWDCGIRYFDTAPLYGHGLSERRLGLALRDRPRDDYVLSTKVGRLLRTSPDGEASPTIFAGVGDVEPIFDFSRDGILRSIAESLERLGLDRIDVVLVHDPDDFEPEAMRSAFPTLLQLRDEGVVGAVGCGMNQAEMLERFVTNADLDCVLLAGRYSLLDRTGADRLLPLCAERGVGVIVGGVFNSGVLAEPDGNPTYDYLAAPPAVLERARRLGSVCRAHDVALPAAALQFAMRHGAVTTVLVGARSADEIELDVGNANATIPAELWSELDAVR
jgi:D-threo-aldose 1-dehydrogenase